MTRRPISSLRRGDVRNGRRRNGDRGFSLVEILVSVTLLGIASGSVLTALGGATAGSARHRELSTATAWLQSAADQLEITPLVQCGPGTAADVRVAYEEEIQTKVANSDNWPVTAIAVEAVKFWDGAAFAASCTDALQLVSLKVASPNGKVTQRLDLVKGDPYLELTAPDGTDPYSGCGLTSMSFAGKKAGDVTTSAGVAQIKLSKPSPTKSSRIKTGRVTLTVVTNAQCTGKLRVFYWYAGKNGKLHRRTIKLKLLKGSTNTYVGRWSKHDKFLQNETIDLILQQGRKKSKLWTTLVNGVQNDVVKFV